MAPSERPSGRQARRYGWRISATAALPPGQPVDVAFAQPFARLDPASAARAHGTKLARPGTWSVTRARPPWGQRRGPRPAASTADVATKEADLAARTTQRGRRLVMTDFVLTGCVANTGAKSRPNSLQHLLDILRRDARSGVEIKRPEIVFAAGQNRIRHASNDRAPQGRRASPPPGIPRSHCGDHLVRRPLADKVGQARLALRSAVRLWMSSSRRLDPEAIVRSDSSAGPPTAASSSPPVSSHERGCVNPALCRIPV